MEETRTRFCPVPHVAARLEWDERTLRRHLVSIEEWRRLGGYESGKVPSMRLGAMYRVPKWWLDRMLADVTAEPSESRSADNADKHVCAGR